MYIAKDTFYTNIYLQRMKTDMKRFVAILLGICLVFGIFFCNSKKTRTIKIGIIDSCISKEMQQKLSISQMNDIIGIETENNITHGSMITAIILQEVSNCEIYYCSIYDENCIGEINDVVKAIDWCMKNNVDIITMSFATLSDSEFLRQSIEKAIKNKIIITASCINLSDKTCYPAMYAGVISISDGFNQQATIKLKGKSVKLIIDNKKIERREVSFLTAMACGKIAKQISKGIPTDKAIDKLKAK